MEKTKEIVEVLQKVLNDKNFITSLMKDTKKYNIRDIEKKLGTVLSYYISTRDTQTDYTYEEIESKYEEIQGLPLDPDTEVYKNTITHGFFTHSFNGYKKDRIMKYGLNYMGMIDDKDTLTEIQEARDMLQQLESILGKSPYLKPLRSHEHSSEEVFITTPGVKTIYYTCQNSPERLYLGPLAQERGKEEPIVVGENKQTYMLRVLTKKIQKKYPDTNSTEYKDAMKLCRDITAYYCSKPPSFALIDIEKVKKMPVFISVYREDKAMGVEEWIKAQREVYMSIFYIGGFFSTETGMTMERNNLGDLVTLSKYIPDGAISGIVDMIDGFDMQQLFARTKGRKIGDLIDYNTCEYRGEPSIEQLLAAITPNATEEELQEIRAKYEKIRQTQELQSELDEDFERRMQDAKEKIIIRKKNEPIQNQEESLESMQVQKNIFLQSIIEQSKKKIGLNEINNFVRNIKTEIMKFFQRNQNEQQNER